MGFDVVVSEKAAKQIKELGRRQGELLIAWLMKNIRGTEDPRSRGKALVGNMRGLWRYRVGDYRIVCDIQDDKLVVLVLSAGHRGEIYGVRGQ
ncbi:MAG: type II toxin-antitoxin system RelE/ParE family toxin [Coriobacteriales bacterium]|jgi:mRNA interferase RelE/StbE|nr:type II toxin-antitoxin system RelE/ParE family toxin [Coriobacteriales bacterium]